MAQSYIGWIPRRIWILGFMAGLLLVAMAGLVPEHIQSATLYAGVSLALLSVGTEVALLSTNTRLKWRGLSPVVGIAVGLIVGALPFIARGPWSHQHEAPAIPTAKAPLRTPAPPVPSAQITPPPQVAESPSPPGSKGMEPALAEVAGLLDQKARPALEQQRRYLISVLMDHTVTRDPDSVRSQLATQARELEEVASSLAAIKSQNRDLSKELEAVIGDTGPLTALANSLRGVSNSLPDDSSTGGNPVIKLRQLTAENMTASQWVGAMDERLTGARAGSR